MKLELVQFTLTETYVDFEQKVILEGDAIVLNPPGTRI